MGCLMAPQITSVSIVYSTVCSNADRRKHQSSASLAFVRRIHRWPVNSPHNGPVTRKMFPFDVIMAYHPGGSHPMTGNIYPFIQGCITQTYKDKHVWEPCEIRRWADDLLRLSKITCLVTINDPREATTSVKIYPASEEIQLDQGTCIWCSLSLDPRDRTSIWSHHLNFFAHSRIYQILLNL